MVVCVNGSERQPSQPARLTLDTNYMLSLLPLDGFWMRPFVPFIPPDTVDVDAFCAVEPPALNALSEDELLALLAWTPPVLAYLAGKKLAQLLHVYLWYKLCR
jgi:hypothetical protein